MHSDCAFAYLMEKKSPLALSRSPRRRFGRRIKTATMAGFRVFTDRTFEHGVTRVSHTNRAVFARQNHGGRSGVLGSGQRRVGNTQQVFRHQLPERIFESQRRRFARVLQGVRAANPGHGSQRRRRMGMQLSQDRCVSDEVTKGKGREGRRREKKREKKSYENRTGEE